VSSIGKGRVKYFRQKENLGSLRNFETCINRAKGELVHLLHGDDRVNPGFYKNMSYLFSRFPAAGAAFCRFRYVNEAGQTLSDQTLQMQDEGILENWLLRVAVKNPTQYVATVVRREVYEKLGAFYGVTYGEDWEMWVRIARHYPVAYTPMNLAEYRKHTSSISSSKFLTGQNATDMLQVMEIIQGYLPAAYRKSVLNKSKKFYAHHGLGVANQIWRSFQSKEGAKAQIRHSLQMHLDLKLLWKIAKMQLKMKFNIL
jgi:glycosyltransferase involved in cell wall biosynthesis